MRPALGAGHPNDHSLPLRLPRYPGHLASGKWHGGGQRADGWSRTSETASLPWQAPWWDNWARGWMVHMRCSQPSDIPQGSSGSSREQPRGPCGGHREPASRTSATPLARPGTSGQGTQGRAETSHPPPPTRRVSAAQRRLTPSPCLLDHQRGSLHSARGHVGVEGPEVTGWGQSRAHRLGVIRWSLDTPPPAWCLWRAQPSALSMAPQSQSSQKARVPMSSADKPLISLPPAGCTGCMGGPVSRHRWPEHRGSCVGVQEPCLHAAQSPQFQAPNGDTRTGLSAEPGPSHKRLSHRWLKWAPHALDSTMGQPQKPHNSPSLRGSSRSWEHSPQGPRRRVWGRI